jgi:hypothetical protein
MLPLPHKAGIRLLKCLCQTEQEKSVAWHTDARSLEKHGVPREFTTTSRVIIICNDWKTLNNNVSMLHAYCTFLQVTLRMRLYRPPRIRHLQ